MSDTEPEERPCLDPAGLETALGYKFESRALLETALKHASYAHEVDEGDSNERLEFLGDSVLGLVVARALFVAHASWDEGDLSLAQQNLVEQRSLAKLAVDLNIGPYLRLGRTEKQSSGENKPGILSDAVEAILGAMYLDGGLEPVERLLERVFAGSFQSDALPVQRDSKTRFQEWVMAKTGAFPSYKVVEDSEVEGDENRFTVEVLVDAEAWGMGSGRSKRKAQQKAATEALLRADQEEKS